MYRAFILKMIDEEWDKMQAEFKTMEPVIHPVTDQINRMSCDHHLVTKAAGSNISTCALCGATFLDGTCRPVPLQLEAPDE